MDIVRLPSDDLALRRAHPESLLCDLQISRTVVSLQQAHELVTRYSEVTEVNARLVLVKRVGQGHPLCVVVLPVCGLDRLARRQ